MYVKVVCALRLCADESPSVGKSDSDSYTDSVKNLILLKKVNTTFWGLAKFHKYVF